MEDNKVYIINTYTKDGVLDHMVDFYRNKIQAQEACKTFQNVCVKTGFVYKVDEYDYDEWLNS